jgi:hypothetical protein
MSFGVPAVNRPASEVDHDIGAVYLLGPIAEITSIPRENLPGSRVDLPRKYCD